MALEHVVLALLFLGRLLNAGVEGSEEASSCREACSGLWGTYRPGLYFGVKAARPLSPLFGIMYTTPDRLDSYNHIRHDCDNRDQMKGFGFVFHDGRCASVQQLPDEGLGVNISTKFLQSTDEHGDGFTVRIEAKAMPGHDVEKLSLVWYTSLEDTHHSFEAPSSASATGIYGDMCVKMDFGDLGKYRLVTRQPRTNSHPYIETGIRRHKQAMDGTFATTVKTDTTSFWDLKGHLMRAWTLSFQEQMQRHLISAMNHERKRLGKSREWVPTHDEMKRLQREILQTRSIVPYLDSTQTKGNALLLQNVFNLPFSIDISLVPESVWAQQQPKGADDGDDDDDDDDGDDDDEDVAVKLPKHLLLSDSQSLVEASAEAFQERFEAIFRLGEKGYDAEHVRFAERAMSDLLGSIGYFHGTSLHKSSRFDAVYEVDAASLLAVVPGRVYFPRGFLWDEGFHQLLLSSYDSELSESIVRSWCGLIQQDGWLPREQILGHEARSRVPAEFQPQDPRMANPPTLFLAILRILNRAKLAEGDEFEATVGVNTVNVKAKAPNTANAATQKRVRQLLKDVYPALVRHAGWYLSTQSAELEGSFRWKQRTQDHCLASGLDDFPRAPLDRLSSAESEGHVDLHCWMVVLCRAMAVIGSVAGADQEEIDAFAQKAEHLSNTLNDFHWSTEHKFFFDYYVANDTSSRAFFEVRGYVNLFPLALQLLEPDSEQLRALLDFLGDDSTVWTEFGVRSLSRLDDRFGSNENYWRGPIWYNINYLLVAALHNYAYVQPGPHQAQATRLYTQLRRNLVDNAFKVYGASGYLWEQYDGDSGEGRRNHPFTGWTALVVDIMAEQY